MVTKLFLQICLHLHDTDRRVTSVHLVVDSHHYSSHCELLPTKNVPPNERSIGLQLTWISLASYGQPSRGWHTLVEVTDQKSSRLGRSRSRRAVTEPVMDQTFKACHGLNALHLHTSRTRRRPNVTTCPLALTRPSWRCLSSADSSGHLRNSSDHRAPCRPPAIYTLSRLSIVDILLPFNFPIYTNAN